MATECRGWGWQYLCLCSGKTITAVCRRFPYARLIQKPIPPDKHYRRPLEGQDLSRTTALVWEPTVEIEIKTTLSRSIV